MTRPKKNRVVDVSETNAQARAAGKTYGEFVAEQTKKTVVVNSNDGIKRTRAGDKISSPRLDISKPVPKRKPGRPPKNKTTKEGESEMAQEKEIKSVEKAIAFEQVQAIKNGADTSNVQHMPTSVREALTKEEIFLTERIDSDTQRIKEIQEFRKKFL